MQVEALTHDLPTCRHRGDDHDGMFLCTSRKLITSTGHVTADTCRRCPYADHPDDDVPPAPDGDEELPVENADRPPCVMRTDALREEKCSECKGGNPSGLVAVYGCQLYGECTSRTTQIRSAGKRVQGCSVCQHHVPAHPPDPPPPPKRAGAVPKRKRLPVEEHEGVVFDVRGRPADCLKDAFFNSGLFLVCGGPSLKKTDLTLIQRPGILTAAVNNAAVHFRPHIWFMCDRQSNFSDWAWMDPGIPLKFTKQKYLYGDMQRWTPGGLYKSGSPRDLQGVWGYKHKAGWDADTFLTDDLPTWGAKNAAQDPEDKQSHKSVMLPALWLSYWLGVRRIYLVGCDWKMKESQPYAFPQDVPAGKVAGNNALYAWLGRRFKELRPHFQKHGLEVTNCTVGGHLEAFPRMALKDAVEFELSKLDFPSEPGTEGYYR